MAKLEKYVCKCGSPIRFESKVTFTNPPITQGICPKCGKRYEVVGVQLKEKER